MNIAVFTKPVMARALALEFARTGLDATYLVEAGDAARKIGDAEIVVIQQSLYDPKIAAAVQGSRNLRLLHLTTSGHERLVGYRFPQGVRLAGSSQALGPYVAEHGVGLLLLLLMGEARDGRYERLRGRTATILGTGAIGTEVARRLERFGVHRIGVSRSGETKRHFDSVWPSDRFHEALNQSSILMLAAPETRQTVGLVDSRALAALQPQGYLVNIARGALVRTNDLVNALCDGWLAGAALDVTDPSPLPEDHILWRMRNVVLTPHSGGSGAEAEVAAHVTRNIERYRSGLELQNVISTEIDQAEGFLRLP